MFQLSLKQSSSMCEYDISCAVLATLILHLYTRQGIRLALVRQ